MKILLIHASAGAGHTHAAEALYDGLKEKGGHQAYLVNSLDYTSSFYKRSYQDTYTFFVTRMPWAWGFFCRLTDVPCLQGAVRAVRRIFNMLTARRLNDYLVEENFDYIFSTHFMAHEVACALKRRGVIKSKIIVVVTDLDVHRIWLAKGADYYTAATARTADKLKQLGVPDGRILVTGIPIDKKFTIPKDTDGIKEKWGMEKKAFSVLMATGSFGIGPIEEIVGALKDFQLLVICGRNQRLYAKLSVTREQKHYIYGLVDNMEEFMAAADVMITKPGGLSISEALVSQLPMIFFSAIPGQETQNVAVLKKYGIGLCLQKAGEIAEEVSRLSTDGAYFKDQKEKIRTIARPNAVRDILKLIS